MAGDASAVRSRFQPRRLLFCAGVALLLAGPAGAVPTSVTSVDVPPCDALLPPPAVDELGTAPAFSPFPDELISAVATLGNPACLSTDLHGTAPDALVLMTNLTTVSFTDVWYVADPEETFLTNVDILVNGAEAFKIDYLGVNVPLVFESILADAIFVPGETWHFIIQDYSNVFGLPPSALGSIGVPSAVAVPDGSSGSIIAIVPEPSTALLLGLGLVGIAVRQRRHTC